REPSEPRAPRATANPFLEVRDAPVALPLALAATGAVVGALLWAGIVYATGMEIGYVAWALGGLVGGGCMLGGGRGPLLAAAAALLAFVGIAGGRIYGTSLLVEHQIDAVVSVFTPGGFAAMKRAALTEADDERPAAPFVETAVEDYDEATAAEVAELAEAERQFRERLRDPSFTFEVWRDQQVAAIRSQVSLWDVLKSTFGLIDVLFVLLGLSTAYGIVARAGVTSGR
ncbi:MAG: hypothetical protein KDE27_22960, partial [Planctomycetes bacterium]|nr:hypothetical protein [Planctomycetota bacterium]